MKKGVQGLYAIFVTHNPHIAYIGSSKCIRTRLQQHHRKLQNGNHDNYKLKRLWGFYKNDFRFKILSTHTDEDEMRKAEQTMISFTPPENLYNIDFTVYNYKR